MVTFSFSGADVRLSGEAYTEIAWADAFGTEEQASSVALRVAQDAARGVFSGRDALRLAYAMALTCSDDLPDFKTWARGLGCYDVRRLVDAVCAEAKRGFFRDLAEKKGAAGQEAPQEVEGADARPDDRERRKDGAER